MACSSDYKFYWSNKIYNTVIWSIMMLLIIIVLTILSCAYCSVVGFMGYGTSLSSGMGWAFAMVLSILHFFIERNRVLKGT